MSRNKPSKKGTRSRTDKEKLELFVKRVNELQQTRLTINGCRISHNIHYEAGQTIQSKLEQPEEADFKEHLLTFRHFISEKEDTFLSRIFGILYVRCIDVSNKQSIVELRKAYETVKLHNNLQIIVNNEKYTPLRITDIYLNSKYFHNDLEEWEFLDNL